MAQEDIYNILLGRPYTVKQLIMELRLRGSSLSRSSVNRTLNKLMRWGEAYYISFPAKPGSLIPCVLYCAVGAYDVCLVRHEKVRTAIRVYYSYEKFSVADGVLRGKNVMVWNQYGVRNLGPMLEAPLELVVFWAENERLSRKKFFL